MPPRYAHFVRGYAATSRDASSGAAPSSSADDRRIDPDMATAWMQLGETYTHLLPVPGAPALMADSAFAEAMRLDSVGDAHAACIRSRADCGAAQAAEAAPLITTIPRRRSRLDARRSDPHHGTRACRVRSVDSVDWAGVVKRAPVRGRLGRTVARGCRCAVAMRGCCVYGDSHVRDTRDGRRGPELSTRVAGPRSSAAGRAHRAGTSTSEAIAAHRLGHRARRRRTFAADRRRRDCRRRSRREPRRSVQRYEEQWGPQCERCTSNDRVWQLGVWATRQRRYGVARDARERTGDARGVHGCRRASRSWRTAPPRGRGSRVATVPADRCARRACSRRRCRVSGELLWRDAEGRGPERLALARALMQRREFKRAIDVADVFDSPASQSLCRVSADQPALRAAAADSLDDGRCGSPTPRGSKRCTKRCVAHLRAVVRSRQSSNVLLHVITTEEAR